MVWILNSQCWHDARCAVMIREAGLYLRSTKELWHVHDCPQDGLVAARGGERAVVAEVVLGVVGQ